MAGMGLGFSVSSLFQTVLSDVPHGDGGSASGAMQSFRHGALVYGAVVFGLLAVMVTCLKCPPTLAGAPAAPVEA